MYVHFSIKKTEWETPQKLFDSYDALYHFDIDVCAAKENAKCKKYFTEIEDGLKQPWAGTCWMNPPYGREISKWLLKAFCEWKNGVTIVCLLPSRTDTRWWHEYAMLGEITFLRGRLKFGGARYNAPFPSAIVIFKAA